MRKQAPVSQRTKLHHGIANAAEEEKGSERRYPTTKEEGANQFLLIAAARSGRDREGWYVSRLKETNKHTITLHG